MATPAPQSSEDTSRYVQNYLHAAIPLSAAMGVEVRSASASRVWLWAPLAPNINHNQTVFGGSGVVLATLSAWTLLHLRLQQAGMHGQLVIQRSSMEYERPIAGDFSARCEFDQEEPWTRFCTLFRRRGRARLTLPAQLCSAADVMGSFVGDFVALRDD